ncbi:hypothetical protein [Wolbachia endosymbiont of Trichogramma kaykai]|uniref:hypothetical protein n=1 Tax=Wolbachia endosymbiont of Trichogramma kaykai TaxID=444066 RepID=UPI0038918740
MFSTSEATKKLFKAIEGAWNHFQQALKEGANVNPFEDGMTPLMCIASAFVTSNNREVVDRSPYLHCIYLDNLQPVNEGFIPQNYAHAEEEIKTGKREKNTALHIACKLGNVNMTKILLTHPKMKINIKNYENKNPRDCIAGHAKKEIEPEFLKIEAVAQERKQTNYACTFFLLSGILTVVLCFVVDNPVPLAAASLLFFCNRMWFAI